jgi:hypothetical protein
MKKLELTVKGMHYRVTISTLRDLEHAVENDSVQCKLVREPTNSHDENAIKVEITERPWAKEHGAFHIGYLDREVAEMYAPLMDGGTFPFKMKCRLIDVDPEHGTGTVELSKR